MPVKGDIIAGINRIEEMKEHQDTSTTNSYEDAIANKNNNFYESQRQMNPTYLSKNDNIFDTELARYRSDGTVPLITSHNTNVPSNSSIYKNSVGPHSLQYNSPLFDTQVRGAVETHPTYNETIRNPQLTQQQQYYIPVNHARSVHNLATVYSDGSGLAMQGMTKNGSRRSRKACDYCRKRKIRCDPVNPNTDKCTNCFKNEINCTFIFHSELMKKKREAYLKGLPTVNTEGSENTDGDSFRQDIDNIIADDQLLGKQDGKVETFVGVMDSKIQKLERKVKVIEYIHRNMIPMLEELVIKHEGAKLDYEFLPKMKSVYYKPTIITSLLFRWVKEVISEDTSVIVFVRYFREAFDSILKWYILQQKCVLSFRSLLSNDNEVTCVHKLPDKLETEYLIKVFYKSLINTTLANQMPVEDVISVLDRYYNEGMHFTDIRSEFFLNVCVYGGLKFSLLEGYRPKEYRERDITLEFQLLANVMFYYNRINDFTAGFTTLKTLLFLCKIFSYFMTSELAHSVLEKSINIAVSLGLNKVKTYEGMASKIAIERMSLWSYCVCRDRELAIELDKPFLLGDTYTNMVRDDTYRYVFTKMIELGSENQLKQNRGGYISDSDLVNIQATSDIRDQLDILLKYSFYIPFVVSYYGFLLSDITVDLHRICFHPNSTIDVAFEQKLDQVVELNEQIVQWRTTLHQCMKYETHKLCLRLLIPKISNNSDSVYESMCLRVVQYHLQSHWVSLMLSLFALSILRDNDVLASGSYKDIEKLKTMFKSQYLDSAMHTLEVLKSLNYSSEMYLEFRKYSNSAMFIILIHIINQIDDKEAAMENALLFANLQDSFKYFIDKIDRTVHDENLILNFDLFLISYFLELTSIYFGDTTVNPYITSVDLVFARYESILNETKTNIRKFRKEAVEIYGHIVKPSIKSGSAKIVGDVTDGFLDMVTSDKAVLSEKMIDRRLKKKPTKVSENCVSLFPVKLFAFDYDDVNKEECLFEFLPHVDFSFDGIVSLNAVLDELDLW